MNPHDENAAGDRQKRIEERLVRLSELPAHGIPKHPRGTPAPLTPMQQQIWFASWLEPDVPLYTVSIRKRLRGPLDAEALRRSLENVVRRQDALRIVVRRGSDGPVQVVQPFDGMELPLVDVGDLPPGKKEIRTREIIEEMDSHVPDLSSEWPIRALLVRLDDEDHAFLVSIHHIVSDGWSRQNVLAELAAGYEAIRTGAEPELPDLPVSYTDYASWYCERLKDEAATKHLTYWREKLSGSTDVELPSDRFRTSRPAYEGGKLTFEIPADLSERLRELGRSQQSTYFITLLSGFNVLLHRYSQQDDVTVGCPVSGRNRQEFEPLVGCFINTLPYRVDLSGRPSFRDVIGRTRTTAFEAFSHQDFSLPQLLTDLKIPRDPGRHPIYQVIFQLANFEKADVHETSLSWEDIDTDNELSLLDMSMTLVEEDGRTKGTVVYRKDLFDRATIRQMTTHFVRILEAMVHDPDAPVSSVELVTRDEQKERGGSRGLRDAPRDPVHLQIEEWARSNPNAIAVESRDVKLTYSDLDRRANQLAHHLKRKRVGPESLVAICLERSPELFVSILAVLKAGGAYIPLDPGYPASRLEFMLRDSDPVVLITNTPVRERLGEFGGEIVLLEEERHVIGAQDASSPGVVVKPHNPAYVIYTSGSTGTPKGVVVEHRTLANLIQGSGEDYPFHTRDRVLQFASVSFDASVAQIFRTLTAGAALVLRTDEMMDHPGRFFSSCEERGITIAFLPTAFWHELVRICDEQPTPLPRSLRHLEVGGESVRPDAWATWHSLYGDSVRFINRYGPTEATVFTLRCNLSERSPDTGREVPIGRPLPHVDAIVLDRYGQIAPAGVPGELHLGGACLARGYLNRPDLTAERFIRHRSAEEPEVRLYRTGDLVRYRHDGNYGVIGRVDRQVKIRGYRVEPGETEAVLDAHPSVSGAVVTATRDAAGHMGLDAYVVARADNGDDRVLLDHLRRELPHYMVPRSITFIKEIPMTPGGKIDRSALPQPDRIPASGSSSFEAPATPAEQLLADIWSGVLEVDRIGRHDDFFELGGHSLLAVQIVTQIGRRFDVEVPLRAVFDSPTIAELAVEITGRAAELYESDDLDQLLAELQDLSEDEVRRLLEDA